MKLFIASIITIIAVLLILNCYGVFSQPTAYTNLCTKCLVLQSAQQILQESTGRATHVMHEKTFPDRMDDGDMLFTASVDNAAGCAIPLDEISAQIWNLVSPQLQGQHGLLSTDTKIGNVFLTRYGQSFLFVDVMWSLKYNRWTIICFDPFKVSINFINGLYYFTL